MGHVGSKTRSLGQFLEKPCVLSRRHSFDPVFMKLCQNDFLTLNKHLSRRAMLSDDSSCFICQRVWKTAKCHGKIREKSGNFEVNDKWQPWRFCTAKIPHIFSAKIGSDFAFSTFEF